MATGMGRKDFKKTMIFVASPRSPQKLEYGVWNSLRNIPALME
jgi:hypothetical protein